MLLLGRGVPGLGQSLHGGGTGEHVDTPSGSVLSTGNPGEPYGKTHARQILLLVSVVLRILLVIITLCYIALVIILCFKT
jgi:hypothetical protein